MCFKALQQIDTAFEPPRRQGRQPWRSLRLGGSIGFILCGPGSQTAAASPWAGLPSAGSAPTTLLSGIT